MSPSWPVWDSAADARSLGHSDTCSGKNAVARMRAHVPSSQSEEPTPWPATAARRGRRRRGATEQLFLARLAAAETRQVRSAGRRRSVEMRAGNSADVLSDGGRGRSGLNPRRHSRRGELPVAAHAVVVGLRVAPGDAPQVVVGR